MSATYGGEPASTGAFAVVTLASAALVLPELIWPSRDGGAVAHGCERP